MALTDEQYQQIFRYADNEMETMELKAFESALEENKELRDEVEFYKQLRLLSESVKEKTREADSWLSVEKESNDQETLAMLADARRMWENQYEAGLKLQYGIIDTSDRVSKAEKSRIRRLSSTNILSVMGY